MTLRNPGADLYADMLRILERLVGFDTTSHRSNLDLIGYVRNLLADNSIDSRLHWNDDRSKASLTARAGPRGAGRPGILWSGHTDVVPVDGQPWTSDPFTLRVTADRAFGRGSADMKGFIACCLAIMSAVDQESLTVPVTLVLTYDEEVGCVGARRLVPELRAWSGDAVGCIVGEPTDMTVVVGHKGKQNHRARFTSEARHAALAPTVANSIVAAAQLAGFAQQLNERFRSDGPRDRRFAIDHSWVNIGRIDGGVKPNIVPADCTMDLEIRTIPDHRGADIAAELGRHADDVARRMREQSPRAVVRVERLSDTPSFVIDATHGFVDLVRSVSNEAGPLGYVPFGTEAGLIWGMAGIPTVVCGPGSIEEAHTADESVPLSQLRTCLARLQALILRTDLPPHWVAPTSTR